jgi:polyphosphate kinase
MHRFTRLSSSRRKLWRMSASSVPTSADDSGIAPAAAIDREVSLLAFNERVLAQSQRQDVPLLERLRYLTIVSSNLDEFFEVRLPDVLDSEYTGGMGSINARAQALIAQQYRVFNEELMPALAAQGIHILNHAQRNAGQRRWVDRYFQTQIRPLLTPVALDPAHPFPAVANKSLNFILQLAEAPASAQSPAQPARIVIVRVPRSLPRVVRLPDRLMPPGEQGFVLLTSIVRAHLAELVPGRSVPAFSQFRVTRDSDLEIDEDDPADLRQALRRGLSRRNFGEAIRLEVVRTCPAELSNFLLRQFKLPAAALYAVNGPVNLVRLNQLIDLVDAPALRFPPFEPGIGAALTSLFERLRAGPLLLHHPFESFEPVVQFLREAVHDERVLAIKQTVYRTGSESVLMDLLLEAVRRGKEVTVVLELKARFDEEANINWAERLEAAGAQVAYGMVGLKTHAKMLLVTRRETTSGRGQALLRRYVHLSTGNYNPRTARLYTDLSLMSAQPELCADVEGLFYSLASLMPMPRPRQLLVAPEGLSSALLGLLGKVRKAAHARRRARVVLKLNSLTDPTLASALIQTAQAGAQIDLIVRGACILRPGVPGLTDRIRVRSVIGRFLEHTRVLYFAWGEGDAHEALYLSSADWMTRNMRRRVEIAWPIDVPAMRQRVIDEALVPYLLDGDNAWSLQADGHYVEQRGQGPAAQASLMLRLGKR